MNDNSLVTAWLANGAENEQLITTQWMACPSQDD